MIYHNSQQTTMKIRPDQDDCNKIRSAYNTKTTFDTSHENILLVLSKASCTETVLSIVNK